MGSIVLLCNKLVFYVNVDACAEVSQSYVLSIFKTSKSKVWYTLPTLLWTHFILIPNLYIKINMHMDLHITKKRYLH